MDWRKAAELVQLGYRSIRGSTVLPLYSFDLWSFAYLLGTGIDEVQLTRFLRAAAGLMVDSMDDPGYRSLERERQLEAVFSA
jgi:hypothetical protein